MRVFVTGASGHIGSAVVPELLAAGHQVTGLARSDASAATLESWGADVRRGTLDDLDILRSAAAESDGVIHLAYKHEAMRSGDMASAVAADLPAVETMLDALAGTGKPFVGTSGTLMLALFAPGKLGTESGRVPGRPAHRLREPGDRDRPRAGADLCHPPAADRAQLTRPPRLRPHPDRHRPRQGRGRLRGRRGEPLAGRAHARRGAPVPAGAGSRRRRARGCTRSATRASRSRRSPRPSAGTWGCRSRASRQRGDRPLQLPRRLRPARQPHLERARPASSSAGSRPTPA